ncbi:MAG TPA: hypothetical protein VFQ45_01115 [Longimicrobium sp.]|nr:hypothetical protein [Longimicrobium sp.]
MKNIRKTAVFASLLLFGAAGCADLDVDNTNQPDRAGALRTAGDIESLISGTFSTWFHNQHNNTHSCANSPGVWMGIASFQGSNSWNNCAANPYSQIPRPALTNAPADANYNTIAQPWYANYRAIAAVSQGLAALAADPELEDDLSASDLARLKAFGKFMLGLGHATLATVYDRAFIVDETTDLSAGTELQPYGEVMTAALGYFDEAAALSSGESFTIPSLWVGASITNVQLAKIARGLKARYRASVARTTAERDAVDWAAVLTDLAAAGGQEWTMEHDWVNWWSNNVFWQSGYGYAWLSYQYYGMADQSGRYQTWLGMTVNSRHPNLGGADNTTAFIIVTPDLRFAQGATRTAQAAAPGRYFRIPEYSITGQWARPDRGTWRWSWYRNHKFDALNDAGDTYRLLPRSELRLLAAEALLRTGNGAAAADSINVSRVFNGLNATNSSGLNTSCVPKLPSSACGGLLHILAWEVWMETMMEGHFGSPKYFFDRRNGFLYKNTALQMPIPAKELQLLQLTPVYTYGGGGDGSAPTSAFAFPHEG